MQLLEVAFNALFSPPLTQATKPKIVIPSYIVQRKSVSVTPQSLLHHFHV